MLKKLVSSAKGGSGQPQSRQEVMDKYSSLNNKLFAASSSASQVAAERYTKGPIMQVIQPLSNDRRLLVTQAINLKKKKPAVLIKHLLGAKPLKRSAS